MERHICLFSHCGLDVYSAVYYIQMSQFHMQHVLKYERDGREARTPDTIQEEERERKDIINGYTLHD